MRVPDNKLIGVVELAFKRYARNRPMNDYQEMRKAYLVGAALALATMDCSPAIVEKVASIVTAIGKE